jgi:hypothetical protein
MDRLKGEPGSRRRKVQQKKPCVFSSSNSTTGLIWTALVSHPDWQLFLLSPEQVEYHFLLAHQHKYVDYYAAGSIVEIRFPASTPKEYAHVVTR